MSKVWHVMRITAQLGGVSIFMYRISDYIHIWLFKIIMLFSGCISLYTQAPPFLGGLGWELAFYPLALGIAIWLAEIIFFREKVYIPRAYSFYAFVLLLIWFFITGIANFTDIMEAVFKGTTGTTRFIIQYGTMMFYFLFALYIYNLFCKLSLSSKKILFLFENAIILSAYIMGAYSFFEITSLLGCGYAREIVNTIDSFFRINAVQGDIVAYLRIRSLTGEASYFGMYCGVIMPWLAWRAFVKKISLMKKAFNIAFFVYYIVLIVFSTSRTAYFIVLLELLFFIISYRKEIMQNLISTVAKALGFLFLSSIILLWSISSATIVEINVWDVLLSFMNSSNNNYDLSNIARIGSQLAGAYMFLDNPFFGVGYGQYPFYYADYVPSWAWISKEVQFWSSNIPGTAMAPSHGIYARLLAETGAMGFWLWLVILFMMIWEVGSSGLNLDRKICFIISIVALMLFGFNIDTFRIFYYWVFLGIVWFLAIHHTNDEMI